MTTTITTQSGHTITYAPPCFHCGHDRNPVITDVCMNSECEIENPHEMPGEQLDRTDLDVPTALRLIARLRELNAPWVAHILARELTDSLPSDGEGEMSDEREAHVAALRSIADILERNPQIKSPFSYGGSIYFYNYDFENDTQVDAVEQMRQWRRAAGGTWNKEYSEDGTYSSADFKLVRDFGGGIKITLTTPRENVCERVVVETVKETVMEYPADAFEGIEKVPVEKERDIVEWRCPDTL